MTNRVSAMSEHAYYLIPNPEEILMRPGICTQIGLASNSVNWLVHQMMLTNPGLPLHIALCALDISMNRISKDDLQCAVEDAKKIFSPSK
ncbi:hypothetical protein [Cylindrospermum sp. FACHB-282]|uniref:hypothetical protein n=1 Tax=Cylindrospermum sp. FACHB-282 TaxID=2692794 RepID=UPI001689A98F|nr:hypothetical protein [Cylindrospermum sp. FACHB-282]MBD2388817.1 hypothetical protein [Cylindrospermum sp. FACHB-282]